MSIETEEDFVGLSRVGKLVGKTLKALSESLEPGVSPIELDAYCAEMLTQAGAAAAPQRIYGFPGTVMVSVNAQAVHGFPSDIPLQPGDLVKLDLTAELDGYMADAAVTVALPPSSPQKRNLVACAESAFARALNVARAGRRINEIGKAIEAETRWYGFHVLRELHSHGVGRSIHEYPSIPNYYDPKLRGVLTEGLVLTIEPILSVGSSEVQIEADGWTCTTRDGSLAVHYEHTVVITQNRPLLLTAA